MSDNIYSSGNSDNLPAWAQDLQPASYNSIPFGVESDEVSGGARVQVNTYPYRDTPNPQNLGAAPQYYNFTAYLVGDDLVSQMTTLKAELDNGKTGTLVHPYFGSATVQLITYSFANQITQGRYVSVRLQFVKTTAASQSVPVTGTDTVTDTNNSADNLDDAAAGDYASDTAGFFNTIVNGIESGASTAVYAVQSVAATVGSFASSVLGVVNSAENVVNYVQGIGFALPNGYTAGRYANGNLTSAPTCLNALPTGLSVSATLTQATALLRAANATNIATVTAAASAASSAVNTGASVPVAVQSLSGALRAAINAPADQITTLATLASFTAPSPFTAGPIATAVAGASDAAAALVRRAVISDLARASASYSPASVTDGQSQLQTIIPLIDAEIVYASSVGDSATQAALKRLKASVIGDMTKKTTGLYPVVTLTLSDSIPLKRLAMRQYGDASREAEILNRNPQITHPLFSGLTVELLAK